MLKFSRGGRLFGLVSLLLVWVVATLAVVADRAQASSFCIADDAFAISNGPGYCFAMAAFSRWYYLTHQGEPPLRKVLDKKAQQHVARQLQEFYSKNLVSLQADFCNQYHGKHGESFNMLVAGLASGEPRLVLLMSRGDRGPILHAVLAYEWVPERHALKVYDPNYSKQERVIDLDKGLYTSLDITYNAICFPEVLNNHDSLVKKMESLYTSVAPRRRTAAAEAWRGGASGVDGRALKAEAYSRRQTR
jgi:hypothetical protein